MHGARWLNAPAPAELEGNESFDGCGALRVLIEELRCTSRFRVLCLERFKTRQHRIDVVSAQPMLLPQTQSDGPSKPSFP